MTEKPLRGAIVGFGFISSSGHLPAYAQAKRPFEIVAVADICKERREAARAALPNARVYEDHRALLDGERGRIDFVDITTPPHMHAQIAKDALARGLHVLCEKPIATSVEEVKSMFVAARESRRVLFPSHNYKHAPVIKAVRQILDARLIGDVRLVTLHTFRNTHARGVREWRPDWRREKKYSGGGIAMDHGSHTFYLAFEWLGTYPTAISAKMSTLGNFDTEDNLSCAITFPNGTASAHLTWTAGMRRVIYTIHGEKGAIRVEDDDVEVAVMNGDGNGNGNGRVLWDLKREKIASVWNDASHVTWFGSLFDAFASAIEKNDYVGKEAIDGLRCIELITTAYASAGKQSRELALGETTWP